jgi:hypothetical protein
MSTVSKTIADNIIAHNGYYDGDTSESRCIRIVKYQNMFNDEDAYGVISQGESLNRYHESAACNNPVIYWEGGKA